MSQLSRSGLSMDGAASSSAVMWLAAYVAALLVYLIFNSGLTYSRIGRSVQNLGTAYIQSASR